MNQHANETGRHRALLRAVPRGAVPPTSAQKVGQLIQADIDSITPDDLAHCPLGSVLNGGNSSPQGDKLAPPGEWLALADRFYDVSLGAGGSSGIPLLWGTDAVHGHNNIPGATIFPHNIGLGATRDPALIRRIGEITAREVRVTGLDWAFFPSAAVAKRCALRAARLPVVAVFSLPRPRPARVPAAAGRP